MGDECPPQEFFVPMVPELSNEVCLPSDEVAMGGLECTEPCSSSEPLQVPLEAAASNTEVNFSTVSICIHSVTHSMQV